MPASHASLPSWRSVSAILLASISAGSVSALGFQCDNILDDRVHWNLKPLDGIHTVSHSYTLEPHVHNSTFSLDLCKIIPQDKDIDKKHQCPAGTRVCGMDYINNEETKEKELYHWVAIAGHFNMQKGAPLEVKPTRLRKAGNREGLMLELLGGKDPFEKQAGEQQIKQKAVVELLCNREMTGWEPKPDPSASKLVRRDDEEGGDEDSPPAENVGSALQFISYNDEDIQGVPWKVLRLEWQTKYACEDASSNTPPPTDGHWGFFTWFIIIAFLGTAAYVILGSWVNYTQYGARGIDLLPHADTLRDIPYIVRDMVRRLQGGGSRGGYSAV